MPEDITNQEHMDGLLRSYYEQTDPAGRLAVLNEYEAVLRENGEDDPLLSYRRSLFEYRFANKKDLSGSMDRYMRHFLDFLFLYQTDTLFPRLQAREVKKTLKAMQAGGHIDTDPGCARAFRLEVRNAAARYFDTCRSDSYHKKFLGIVSSGQDEKERQRCIDTWRMSLGLAEKLGIQTEMKEFNLAMDEAYRLSTADGASLQDDYSSYTA